MPKQALYLKWRPQTFDDVIGQEHITRTLQNSIETKRIRHAYLFSGPRGTGKTTTARLLAHALGSKNLDLIEIDAASHTSVDDVRDLRDKIAFMPADGDYKVYIIDEVHRFSKSAFDALLKTLEEPPAHAIFVLATTEIDKVPDTIKSRCLQFEFRRVSLIEVADRLQMIAESEGIHIDRAALELIARHGTGSVRDSISLLDQIVADPHEHVTLELTQRILGTASSENVQQLAEAILMGDVVGGLHAIQYAMNAGSDPNQFGKQLVEHLRHVLLAQAASTDLIEASDEMRQVYQKQAQMVSRPQLLKVLQAFNTAVNDKGKGWNPQLALELALIESMIGSDGIEEQHAAPSAPSAMPTSSSLMAQVAQLIDKRIATIAHSLPQQPPTTESAAPMASTTSSGISLAQVQQKWSEVRQRVEKAKPTLVRILDRAQLLRVEAGTVKLLASNKFDYDQLGDGENVDILNHSLSSTYQTKLRAEIVIGDDLKASEAGASSDGIRLFSRDRGANITPIDSGDELQR